jgi:hypothetical protein
MKYERRRMEVDWGSESFVVGPVEQFPCSTMMYFPASRSSLHCILLYNHLYSYQCSMQSVALYIVLLPRLSVVRLTVRPLAFGSSTAVVPLSSFRAS